MRSLIKISVILVATALLTACSNQDEGIIGGDQLISEDQLKSAESSQVIEGRYIVVFKDFINNPAADAGLLKAKFGLEPGHIYENCFKGFSAFIPEQALNGLKNNPDIDFIEPDRIMSTCAQILPTGIRRIQAVGTSSESTDVDVAVLDTGVDADHPDLNVQGGVRYYRGRFTDSNYDDDHGHGSHVAGTIGALNNNLGVVGVAPGARIWAVKVLSANGSGYLSDIIKGLDWVKARADEIEVINMSIGGGGYSTSYRNAIKGCVESGVVVVVAAGNESRDIYGNDGIFGTSDDRVPAAYPEAATISALADSDGQPGGEGGNTSYGPDDSFATFSNYSRSVVSDNPVNSAGKAIDLILPGVSIYSCYKNGGYATMSGTSMATPHAAGLAGLYIARHGRATNAAGVYAIRQGLIDAGKGQEGAEGLKVQNDPDGNRENLGWADSGSTPVNQPPVADFTFSTSGFAASFTDASYDPDGTVVSWSWDFGDGNSSDGQNPTHTYSGAGTFRVMLTVTDNGSETATTSQDVLVTELTNNSPVADFTFSISGLTATFTDTSTDSDGSVVSRSWDFGDGNSTSGQNPSHTYASAGTYSVILTVTDNDGAFGTVSRDVTVAGGGSGEIILSAEGTKFNKVQYAVNLTWSGATSSDVDIYMNDTFIATTPNNEFYTDMVGKKPNGDYMYKVCESGTSVCSNNETVTF